MISITEMALLIMNNIYLKYKFRYIYVYLSTCASSEDILSCSICLRILAHVKIDWTSGLLHLYKRKIVKYYVSAAVVIYIHIVYHKVAIEYTFWSHMLSGGSLDDRSALAYLVWTALLHKCIDSCPDASVNGREQNLHCK